ncbi:MAG: hypothetical protein JWP35_3842 [Caulobacter sp.]|nr:hypothetical protein [Caulobacter sp.]
MTHLLIRTATAVLLAASLGACASTPRYPTVAGQAEGTGPRLATPAYPIREARVEPLAPVADASMADEPVDAAPTAAADEGPMAVSPPRAASVVSEEALPDRPAPKDEISRLDVVAGEYAFLRVSDHRSALPPADAPGAKGKKGKKAEPAKGAALKGKVSPSKKAPAKKAAAEKACTGRHCKAEPAKAAEKPCKGRHCKAEPVKAAAEKPCKGKHCKAAPKAEPAKSTRGRHSEEAAPTPVKSSAKATPGVIAGGAVVSVEGPPVSYKVKSGDTVDGVADKLNTSRKQLVADNKLKSPFHLKLGQVLRGPASHGKAYVVQSGDTLYAIARRFSVDASDLADYNDMRASAALKPGRRLDLPPGFKDRGVPKASAPPRAAPVRTPVRPPVREPSAPIYPQPTPQQQQPVQQPPVARPAIPLVREPNDLPPTRQPEVPGNPTTQPSTVTPSRPQPYAPTTPSRPQQGLPPLKPTAALSPEEIIRVAAGRFSWPVDGQVVSSFGSQPGGRRNDGIDIQGAAGAVVRSADDGKVLLSNVVPGLGRTVLVSHTGGWVSVYAGLGRSDVKTNDVLKAGDPIGVLGATAESPTPQLHFELRYSPRSQDPKKAYNPTLVLPAR